MTIKFFILLSIVSIAISQVAEACIPLNLIEESHAECSLKLNPESLALLETDPFSINDRIKEYRYCLLDYFLFWRNGKINRIKQDSFYEVYVMDKKALKVIHRVIKECRDFANEQGKDSGEIAALYFICIEKKRSFVKLFASQICQHSNSQKPGYTKKLI